MEKITYHFLFLFTKWKINMNFHTWNQNDKKFKKEIRTTLIHKIRIYKVTKNKKKYPIIFKNLPIYTKS
jgi:hypothetical protein